ncbi:MAG TPA: DUF5668 domain-containing protein [Vicinamibacteria bacterium]|nr:DUF5668 domain-containing protein [Vicinamibacteria bacterium]
MRSDLGSRLTQGLFGGLLILLGVTLLTGRFGLADLGAYWRYWPLFLVVIGVGHWLNPGPDDSPGDGFWFVFLGLLFLAHNLHLLRLGQSWPLFLVAIGAAVAWRALHRSPVGIEEVRHDS